MTLSNAEEILDREASKEIISVNLEKAFESSIRLKDYSSCLEELERVDIDFIPYAAVSRFVYTHSADLYGFIVSFEKTIEDELKNDNDLKVSRKILEHIELAFQQKESLFQGHEKELVIVKNNYDEMLIEYNNLVEKYKGFEGKNKNLATATEELKDNVQKAHQEIAKNSINQISVLGIFAAILMGAFGSIQAFANIFENAHRLDLGMILILSAVGGTSVIVILHLLLHSISKLTKQSVRSVNRDDASPFEKYPFFFLALSGMVLIALIGVATNLSNIIITFSWRGLWWLLPILWLAFMFFLYNKKVK